MSASSIPAISTCRARPGREALDHRLVNAAIEVCGTASTPTSPAQDIVASCRADVLAKARTEGEQVASRGAPITSSLPAY